MTDPTPLPELLKALSHQFHNGESLEATWARAFQAGADQELQACCRQLTDPGWYDEIKNLRGPFRAAELRAARRPQPPSLKEQALKAVEKMQDLYPHLNNAGIIRRALESLPDD